MSLTLTAGGKIPITQSISQFTRGSAQLLYGLAPTGNTAVSFPGTSGSYVNFGTNGAIFNINSSNVLCEAWLYLNSSAQYSIAMANVVTGAGSTQYYTWQFAVATNGKPSFRLNNTTGGNAGSPGLNTGLGTNTISNQTWTHVTWFVDTTSSKVYVAVNGSWSTSFSPTGPFFFDSNASFLIGGNDTYLNGYIQDLRIIKGGVVTTSSNFTPQAAPWASGSVPSYITGGTNVFGLSPPYMQQIRFFKS